MIKGVLFDMDGVLFDSERVGEVIFQRFCKKRNYPEIHTLYLKMLGFNYEMDRQFCLESLGSDFPFDEAMAELFTQRTALAYEGKISLKAGVLESLLFLKNEKIPTAIVSGTNRDLIMTYLNTVPGMAELFQAIVPGDLGLPSKPSPDPYLKAAELLDLCPEECLGIEDSINGVRSLHAAGITSVCIPDLISWNEAFHPYTDFHLETMLQLPLLINRLNMGGKLRA